jgi:hypothetical protein
MNIEMEQDKIERRDSNGRIKDIGNKNFHPGTSEEGHAVA